MANRGKPPGPARPVLPIGAPVREKVRGVLIGEEADPTPSHGAPIHPGHHQGPQAAVHVGAVPGAPQFPQTLPPGAGAWAPMAGPPVANRPSYPPGGGLQTMAPQQPMNPQMSAMMPAQAPPGGSWLPAMTQMNMQAVGGMTMMGLRAQDLQPNAVQTQVVVSKHAMPEEVDPRLVMVRNPDSQRAAAYRILRHRLMERGDPRVVCVTSAVAGEGKTTTAVNLAIALGECGRARVLLMEANLRNPRLAPILGFRPPECFSEQLTRHRDQPLEPWSVVEVFWPWLHVAAVDPKIGGKPLLDAPAFEIAVARLRPGYDYVVIDTPSVLGAADVNLIEDAVDAVVLAATSKKSRGRDLQRAVEQLTPAKIAGVVYVEA